MKTILKSREEQIIEMRFGLNGKKPKTQKEVAKVLGISQSYIKKKKKKVIKEISELIRI